MADAGRRSRKRDRSGSSDVPKFLGWSTSDAEEIKRRVWRGQTEEFSIEALDSERPIFGEFRVESSSGNSYGVEIRDLGKLANSCNCHDFWNNRLGTCKHIEAVKHRLKKADRRAYNEGKAAGSPRIEVHVSAGGQRGLAIRVPPASSGDEPWPEFEAAADQLRNRPSIEALEAVRSLGDLHPDRVRVSMLLDRWVDEQTGRDERLRRRESFLSDVEAGKRSIDVLRFPLYPYQREGMLHLAFGERAMLADDMGLGKTVQGLAACVLLRELGAVERVLVVCPVSLKTEWKEQIEAATDLDFSIVSGPWEARAARYKEPSFFTIVNYEQILSDLDQIQEHLAPDVVILDEAQRIKNWRTKTASAVKRLRSRFAFVLTGTPIENRIDELYSIVQFLEPGLLGPLFRFNRDYYDLDERGRPVGVRNLDKLSGKIQPVMLRRRKDEVESQLPGRTFNTYFLDMTDEQRIRYEDHERIARRWAHIAAKRPLTADEFKYMQAALARMRMTCDTPFILDSEVRDCPKLDELERVLDELMDDPDRKILVFSEWVRMLELVRGRLNEMDIDHAWHTGSVPQDRRRAEITRFKRDPGCRLFLSSESGGTGLNLQIASVVVNLDLPWNPAKLEQRIARAWRKHQTRPVNVLNFVTRNSIEHRMLSLLEDKQALADAVLDGRKDGQRVDFRTGRAAFIERLQKVMAQDVEEASVDPMEATAVSLQERFGSGLDRIEVLKSPDGSEILLVILEGTVDSEMIEPPDDSGSPSVQFISREGYEAVRRLEAAGQLTFLAKPDRTLFAREERRDDLAARRLEEARSFLAKAEHLQKMTTLLANGGFVAEAEAKAGEIAENCIRALSAMTPPEPGAAEETLVDMCERLGRDGALPASIRYQALSICDLSPDDDGAGPADAGQVSALARADGLLAHARKTVAP